MHATHSDLDWTAKFRPIAPALAALPCGRPNRRQNRCRRTDRVSSFAELQDALPRGRAERLTYRVFDLMHLDGHDLTCLHSSQVDHSVSYWIQ